MTPIELLLCEAMQLRAGPWGLDVVFDGPADYVPCLSDAEIRMQHSALVYPQVRIGPYRVDFLVLFRDKSGDVRPLVVECDGRDFHDRTPDQAARDRKRDRYLALHSIVVLRFTGSELWADPHACAQEVVLTVGLTQVGPRKTVWLGNLSDEQQEAEREREEDAARAAEERAWRAAAYREHLREGLRKQELAREAELEEGYYP